MRLLMVSHFYEAHGGGIERVAGHLCRALERQGHGIAWAASTGDAAPAGPIEAVPLSCFDPLERLTGLPLPIPGPRALRRLRAAIAAADAVIVHDALYFTSIAAMIMAKRAGKRTVLIQHIAAIPFRAAILRALMTLANRIVTRPMLRAADALVFIGDTVRRELVGEPPWRDYRLVFNGVDRGIFNPDTAAGPVARPGRQVLFVGRYVEKKGLAVLRALAAARPDLSLRMAGAGPIDPRGWGLANVADLGPLSPKQLAEEYRNADLLLLPSVGEGYPLVIQEAMACGLPVVCGEPADRADPAATDYLAGVEIDLADPNGSAQRCAAAIDALPDDPVQRRALAAFAASRYDWDRMAQAVAGLCQPELATNQ